ncbi:kinase-like domain-containing protein [Blakeslea trispora]|nr:kinase-like domain-containing protein [Blakeslea trispora]
MRAVENIISERKLLEQINCNLIVNMRYAFQDDDNLFMVLDLMLGGDLRFHLDRLTTMPEEYVRFYAAEIAVSLHYLHSLNIVHRDLKPDNILLDEQGHAHLTDFNIATIINNSKPLTSVAGSFAYIAPEVLQKRGYLTSVDWWSLGVVLYELLFGKRPFRGKTNDALQQAILSESVQFPDSSKVTVHAKDFIRCLLTRDIKSRLGVGPQGFKKLMKHPWLDGIEWNTLETKQAQPPFVPDNKRANFDPTHELEEILLEENPLKVKKRSNKDPKKSGVSYATSVNSKATDSIVEHQSPERQLMEDKFLIYDYSKPNENEQRRKLLEQRQWAQRMNKTTGQSNGSLPANKRSSQNGSSNMTSPTNKKAAGTYKTSVLEYMNQKPATPLSAGDILKLEELARSARSGTRDRMNDWRPPSGLIGNSPPDGSPLEAIQARDDYILKSGGIPPPSKPPPILTHQYNRQNYYQSSYEEHHSAGHSSRSEHRAAYNGTQQPSSHPPYRKKSPDCSTHSSIRSDDESYRLNSSPDNSEYPLMASVAALSQEQQQQQHYQPMHQISVSTTHSNGNYSQGSVSMSSIRQPPVRRSSIPNAHGAPLPPPSSLPPPIPTTLPSMPAKYS